MVRSLDLMRLLLDPERLAVVGAIATVARDLDAIESHTGLPRRAVVEAVAALRGVEAVTEESGRYRLDALALRDLATRLPQPDPPGAAVFHGMTAAEAEILARFFEGDRLTELPGSRSKRLVVLERLALEFEPGRRYAEREVNALLERFHPDYASLRRYLVDEGLLDRDAGVYWRSGGRVVT